MDGWREIKEQPVETESLTLRHVFDSCIVPSAGARFRGDEFRHLCGPCVYMFIADSEPLYIGASACGLSRPSGQHHMEIARDEADEVLIWPCRSEKLAFALESLLLSRIYTKYNSRYAMNMEQAKVAEVLGVTPWEVGSGLDWSAARCARSPGADTVPP